MTNVFAEVYNHLHGKPGAANKSLFNALNREDIQTIILSDGAWWAEQNTTSRGLTDAQHRTLKTTMKSLYNLPWLHNTTLEAHSAS